MVRDRLNLDNELRELLASVDQEYKTHCYFRPPSIGMKYPCILYDLMSEYPIYADNKKFLAYLQYQVIVIDLDPDSKIFKAMLNFYQAMFDRLYQADDLNHFVFTVLY